MKMERRERQQLGRNKLISFQHSPIDRRLSVFANYHLYRGVATARHAMTSITKHDTIHCYAPTMRLDYQVRFETEPSDGAYLAAHTMRVLCHGIVATLEHLSATAERYNPALHREFYMHFLKNSGSLEGSISA